MALTQEQYQAKLRAQRERRWTRKAEGKCIDCGHKHETGHDRCIECHEYHLEQSRKAKVKRREAGVKCQRCARPVDASSKTKTGLCPACREPWHFEPSLHRRNA